MPAATQQSAPARNNYLLIVLDSCRFDSFVQAKTKFMSKLGQLELRWSYASWTAPSHYNLPRLCFAGGHATAPRILIFCGVADEARIELNGLSSQRPHVGDELVVYTGPAEKLRLRHLPFPLWILAVLSIMGGLVQAQGLLSTPSLDRAERLHYYLERTYGLQRLSWLAVDTAVDHLLWEPEWGRGARGYGCQYASGFGRRLISNSIEFGAGLALHEDVGFHRSHRVGVIPRMRYAAAQAFVTTGAGERTEPAYARFAGITGAALIVPAWHRKTLSGSGFAWDIASSTMDQVQNSFLAEFAPDLKRFGQTVWRRLSRNP